jgi:hypothetical protein
MESDKVPPGVSNTTVPAFFPFVSGLTETFDTFPCSPMAQLLERTFRHYEDLSRIVLPLIQYGDGVL